MQFEIGSHLDETDLEQYSMGKLAPERVDSFEEHFLACELCQDRLLDMEAYVNAVRSVSPKLRQANRPRWRERFWRPRPTWVAAFAMGVVVLGLGRVWLIAPRPSIGFAAVFLYSSRGIEGLAVAKAPAGKPLVFNIDLTELPALPSYLIEIVNSQGQPVWQVTAEGHDGKIAPTLKNGLSTGQYYLRLYTTAGKLLREFGLRVEPYRR
jgi:hypothetical protein